MRTRREDPLQSDIVQDEVEDEEQEEEEDDDTGNEEGTTGEESPKRKKRKHKRSHRCKTWSEDSTRTLISEYKDKFDRMDQFPDRNSKENRKAWKGITKALRKIGYSFSVKSAQAKWDALEAEYMEMASRNVHPGLKRVTCPFGRELTAILNPSGMKNYLQIEEDVRKDREKEAKCEQDSASKPTTVEEKEPETIVLSEAENKDGGDESDTGSVCVIDFDGPCDSSKVSPRPPSEIVERPPVICTTVDLTTGEDDGPSAERPSVECIATLRRNVVLHKSLNYTEIAQNKLLQTTSGPTKQTNEDMLLGIACQLHRHLVHHQPRVDVVKEEGDPMEGTSAAVTESPDETADRTKTIGFLESVIEKLMLEKEKKLMLLEERNAIDRERVSLERSKMHLMEQLIALVHTNRRT